MFKLNALKRTDGYKIGHPAMLAPGTNFLYGTWIPRSFKRAPKGITKIVSFGQQLTWKWLHDEFFENFFQLPKDIAVHQLAKDFSNYLNLPYDVRHFEALHDLGYLPLKVKALPEGIETGPNIPHMTFINTVKGFAWLPLYVETPVSSLAWKPSTSATLALAYKRLITQWIEKTDPASAGLIPYLAHDFSARGLDPWSSITSGLGHASSFRGSDTLSVMDAARYFYHEPEDETVINSVNASEHSVSTTCIFTMGEKEMIRYFMRQCPRGILSIVADTFDLWKLITEYLPEIKDEIMARDGKIVIRPDSGDPVDIICGLPKYEKTSIDGGACFQNTVGKEGHGRRVNSESEAKGVIELLWDIFGGTVNEQGYKVLDPHIGAIYGDSITLERAEEIYKRLEAKGFAASNIVFGVGSFTYQYNTRDTFGFAAKGGWFEENGNAHNIYKDPITDDGSKKSPKGLLRVDLIDREYVLKQECTLEEENGGELQVIYQDGEFFNQTTFKDVRERIDNNIAVLV